MSPFLAGGLALCVLFVLLAAGMPIGFAMALVGFGGYVAVAGLQGAIANLGLIPYSSVASYVMSVLPLFVLMGMFATKAGLVKDAFFGLHTWLRGLRGGLAVATVGANALFGGVCGSSMAAAGAFAPMAYPQMRRLGYAEHFACASVAAGGVLSVLIPPSIPMVIYALFADESVGRLFIAGIAPGVLLTMLMGLVALIWPMFDSSIAPATAISSLREKLVASKSLWPVLMLALLVLGGIWGGVFSPTEAAGVGASLALVIGIAMKRMKGSDVMSAAWDSALLTGKIFTVVIGAMIFNSFLVVTGVGTALGSIVTSLGLPRMGVLIAILSVYLILGCVMDTLSMTVLTLPVFLPVLSSLGFDLVWFGVVFVIMTEIALVTPPIGMNVFVVAAAVPEVRMHRIFVGIVPFLVAMVICEVLIVAFPQIALFLPGTMLKAR